MTATDVSSTTRPSVTISQWRTLQGQASEPVHILLLLERAQSNRSNAWIFLATPEQIIRQWEDITSRRSHGQELALFGISFAVKNMDQFATGLSGTRSPYGAVANAFDTERVSGAAVLEVEWSSVKDLCHLLWELIVPAQAGCLLGLTM